MIEQVEAWVAEGALSAEDAADLLACAEDVADGPDLDFATVSAGNVWACGVTTGGDAYCWGANPFGQLGDGTTDNSDIPVAVSGGLSFASITAATVSTCGLTTSGDAYCWGGNPHGQLGDGTNVGSNTPVAVAGGLAFIDISAGDTNACGVTTDGDAYCWGANPFGQLGDGTNTNSSTPVAVVGGLHFVDITAGTTHACGAATAEDAYCWGGQRRRSARRWDQYQEQHTCCGDLTLIGSSSQAGCHLLRSTCGFRVEKPHASAAGAYACSRKQR